MKRALVMLVLLSLGIAFAPPAGASHRDAVRERFARRLNGFGGSSLGNNAFDFSDPRLGRFDGLAGLQDMPGFDQAAAEGANLDNPLDATSPAAANPLQNRNPRANALTDAPERVEADPVAADRDARDLRASAGARGSSLPRTGSPVAALMLLGVALLNGGLFLREFSRRA